MGCDPVRVTGYVDEELPAPLAAEVDRHLWTCPACAAQAAFESTLPRRLRRVAEAALPPGLERRISAWTVRVAAAEDIPCPRRRRAFSEPRSRYAGLREPPGTNLLVFEAPGRGPFQEEEFR